MLLFFYWAPWIDCNSLDELALSAFRNVRIPEGAECFYINHGEVGFRNHMPINEEPIPFILVTGLLILCLAALFILNQQYRKMFIDKNDKQINLEQ